MPIRYGESDWPAQKKAASQAVEPGTLPQITKTDVA
jgi:hypothetical protein